MFGLLAGVRNLLRVLVRRRRYESELAEEMSHHVESLARDLEASGLDAAAARREAERRFGDRVLLRERSADAWSLPVIDGWAHDVRHGARALLRSPGYTLPAVLILGLATGATTAVYSIVDGVLLRPLPYAAAEELYAVQSVHPQAAFPLPPSYPDYADLRAAVRQSELAFAHGDMFALWTADGREQVLGALVSDNFFAVLGTRPWLGREFGGVDAGALQVVVGHGFWQRWLGADRQAAGRRVQLGERTYTVVGVMPQGFAYPEWAQLWLPVAEAPALEPLRQREWRVDNAVVARAGSPDAARAELEAAAAALAAEHPGTNDGWSVALTPLHELVTGDARRPLALTLAAVGLVLLIACANVANLALVRASTRERELAVRAALGAGRWRVSRQLLTESALLALAGGVVGAGLAHAAVRLVRAGAPGLLPRLDEVGVDARVLLFTAAVSAACAMLSGLAPVGAVLRRRLYAGLVGGAHAGERGGMRRMRGALVALEFAIALTLLAGAGLLVKSLQRVHAVELGIEPERVVAMHIVPPSPRYDAADAAAALYERIVTTVRALPGVEAAGVINHPPLGRAGVATRVVSDALAPDVELQAMFRVADADYFRAVGMSAVEGRLPTAADGHGAPNVVINRRLADVLHPAGGAVGRRITVFRQSAARPGFREPVDATIVGVTGDVRSRGPDQPVPPEVFVPLGVNVWPHVTLAVRVRGSPAAHVAAIRSAVTGIEPELPITGLAPMATRLDTLLASRRFGMSLISAFAVIALLLAGTGVYAVMAFAIALRTREIGIRTALGAQPAALLRLLLGHALRLTAAGAALGLLGALAVGRLLGAQLFEVQPGDPVVIGLVVVLLLVVAMAATLLPARRAIRLDPVRALRTE